MKIKNYTKGRADFEVTIEPSKSMQIMKDQSSNLVSNSGKAIKIGYVDRDTLQGRAKLWMVIL